MYSSGESTDEQLFKWAKQLHVPLLLACFKDKLNDYRPIAGGYIINMASSNHDGTHWTALWLEIDDGISKAAYFESFGAPVMLEVSEFCRRFGAPEILYSCVDVQNIHSAYCGQYCLDFLSFMSRNKHLPFEERYRLFLHQFRFSCC